MTYTKQKVVQIELESDYSATVLLAQGIDDDHVVSSEAQTVNKTFRLAFDIPINSKFSEYLATLSTNKFSFVLLVDDPTPFQSSDEAQSSAESASGFNNFKGVYCYRDGDGNVKCVP